MAIFLCVCFRMAEKDHINVERGKKLHLTVAWNKNTCEIKIHLLGKILHIAYWQICDKTKLHEWVIIINQNS